MSAFEITRYADLVNKAKIVERNVKNRWADENNSRRKGLILELGIHEKTQWKNKAEYKPMQGVQDLMVQKVWEVILEVEEQVSHHLDLLVQNLLIQEELSVIDMELKVMWFEIVHCHGQIYVTSVDRQDT